MKNTKQNTIVCKGEDLPAKHTLKIEYSWIFSWVNGMEIRDDHVLSDEWYGYWKSKYIKSGKTSEK